MTHPFKNTDIKHYDGTDYDWVCLICRQGQKKGLYLDEEYREYLVNQADETYGGTLSDEFKNSMREEINKSLGKEMWCSITECWCCGNRNGYVGEYE